MEVAGPYNIAKVLFSILTVEEIHRVSGQKYFAYFAEYGLELTIVLEPEDAITCFTVISSYDFPAVEGVTSFSLMISDIRTVPEDTTRIALGIDEIEIFIIDDESELATTPFLGHHLYVLATNRQLNCHTS